MLRLREERSRLAERFRWEERDSPDTLVRAPKTQHRPQGMGDGVGGWVGGKETIILNSFHGTMHTNDTTYMYIQCHVGKRRLS